MKLPAVAITAAFACGVALGLCPPIAQVATSHFCLVAGFVTAAFLLVIAIVLLNRLRFGAAASVSGASWILIGLLGGWISEQPLPSTHVGAVADRTLVCTPAEVELSNSGTTPLACDGVLRIRIFAGGGTAN